MKNAEATTDQITAKEANRMEAIIEAEAATGPLGIYNPVALVKCPHCGGLMEAIDAKKHVRNA